MPCPAAEMGVLLLLLLLQSEERRSRALQPYLVTTPKRGIIGNSKYADRLRRQVRGQGQATLHQHHQASAPAPPQTLCSAKRTVLVTEHAKHTDLMLLALTQKAVYDHGSACSCVLEAVCVQHTC